MNNMFVLRWIWKDVLYFTNHVCSFPHESLGSGFPDSRYSQHPLNLAYVVLVGVFSVFAQVGIIDGIHGHLTKVGEAHCEEV